MIILPYEFGTPEYLEAIALRDIVLRKPLGLSINDDPLELEYDQIHIGLYEEEAGLVGTCTLQTQESGALKMRQVAIHPDVQRKGYGRALVSYCERYALAQEAPKLYCHAREVAMPFYKKCNWAIEGEVFTEVGIPHYKMQFEGLSA